MILIIQYFSYKLVCRRKIVSNHSDARQQWMIDSNQTKTKMNDHTNGGEIYSYIYFTRKFYNLLSRVRASKEIQWYFSIIPCDQSTKSYLPGVSTYFRLRLRTSKLLSVILYRLKLMPLVDYHLLQYPQHSYEKNIHLLFGWINRYFSYTNYYISQKRTGCDQAVIHFRNKQVIYYHNQTSNIFYLFGWINRASARTMSIVQLFIYLMCT